MPRKILISFLGAISYSETKYYFKQNRSDISAQMYYVQEAILRKHQKIDKAIVFTTNDAYKNNFNARIQTMRDADPVLHIGEGIGGILEGLKKEKAVADFSAVNIPNGYTEEEIWTVFQRVFNQLQEGDEVIFDITFGFRSLPMLVMVLLNYAKVLTGISITAVYYGVYEAGRAEKAAQLKAAGDDEMKKQTILQRPAEAPVLELSAFVRLQEWTQAAKAFEAGNSELLAAMLDAGQADMGNSLLAWTQSIQTCRGMAIKKSLDVDYLKNQVLDMGEKSDIAVQLKPLLKKITAKLAPFESHQLKNGFIAVEWCIEHGMIQQGLTFLQETLQSLVVEQIVGEEFLTNEMYRMAANGALYGFSTPKKTIDLKNRMNLPISDEDVAEAYQNMYEFVKGFNGLSSIYNELSGNFRNDIAHCGMRSAPKYPQELKQELTQFYQRIKDLNLTI